MSKAISTKPPSGMRDFLAADVVRRRYVLGVVQRVYESFGFVPLETPTIEHLSTLLGKYGPEGDQLLYRLLHRRDKLKRAIEAGADKPDGLTELELAAEGLRYDLTVPLARVVANYKDLPAFYKRYQIQPVWRADRPARGRFREFYQCDVDITGTKSLVADAEVCAAIATVLRELGFRDFRILTNHRELLRALVAEAGIPADAESTALIALDKLDKIGVEGVRKELGQKQLAAAQVDGLFDSLDRMRGDGALAQIAQGDGPGAAGARELLELFGNAAQGPAADHLVFDPTLARGLSYYTGPIFEVQVDGLSGSMGGGGRYDNLIGMFQKQQVAAVGFSLGLERVLLVMTEREMFPELGIGPELLLCSAAGVAAADVLAVASRLRADGLRVEVYADAAPMKKQLGYANAIGVSHVGILGPEEVAAGTVALKDLNTGAQLASELSDVSSRVRG
ncbi:MAG: histidine--tRNA ligase [Planctomycetota bacterium]|nr:histidine--tRNA ligase [Planctomycetota bacterium]